MLRTAVCLAAIATALILPSASAEESTPAIDPKAREVLMQMGAYIQGLSSFEISGESASDARLGEGLIVQQHNAVTLVVKRPDRIRADIDGDYRRQDLYLYKGVLTLFTHAGTGGYFYAQAEVPGSLGAAMEYALDEFDLEAPLADLLFEDVSKRFVDDVDSALYLGKSRIRGVECHHVVVRDPELDVQVWVATGEKPLMKKIVITNRWEAGSPRFSGILDWKVPASADDELFIFKPPSDSMKIEFTRVSQ